MDAIIPANLALDASRKLEAKKSAASPNDKRSSDPLTETGTRHNQMRSIAVYMRTQGRSREECRKAMLEWYEEQDPALIHSDRETVLRETEEMLDWVFSERFELRGSSLRSRFSLSSSDARMIASAGCRSRKRILFLLTAMNRCGLSAISYVEIAKQIGSSRNAVANGILQLLATGRIQRRIGGHYLTASGHYGTERNQYTVPYCRRRRGEGEREISLKEVQEHFDESYLRCMELLTVQERQQYCSQKELAEMAGAKEEELVRIDLEGKPRVFQCEEYGTLVAYKYEGRLYYPLLDVAKCLKVNHPQRIAQRCQEKRLFAVPVGTHIVGKGFADAECLRRVLQNRKSAEKEQLIHWLLNEEANK